MDRASARSGAVVVVGRGRLGDAGLTRLSWHSPVDAGLSGGHVAGVRSIVAVVFDVGETLVDETEAWGAGPIGSASRG